MRRPSKKKLLAQIERSSGIIYTLAQQYDVTRQTIYNWIKTDDDFQEALDDARSNLVDVVESKYFKHAVDGSERAQEFILKTLGKDRGYAEKKELEVSGDVNYELPPLDDEALDFLKEQNRLRREKGE